MRPDDLLKRIAQTLREDIAPVVSADYGRTQAHMAAVVLRKLAAEYSHAESHAAAWAHDIDAMFASLATEIKPPTWPQAAIDALAVARHARDDNSLGQLIEAVYAARAAVGAAPFERALGLIRQQLKARLGRELEVAS